MATFFKRRDFQGDSLKIDKVGKYNTMPTGWNRAVQSMAIEEGYHVCMYDKQYLSSPVGYSAYCTGEGNYFDLTQIPFGKGTWQSRVQSFQLRKDCGNPVWMWDEDCKYGNPERTVGNCSDKDSQCQRNRRVFCNQVGNQTPECLEFCNSNHGVCDTMMYAYCKTDAGKDTDICSCINSPATKYNPVCIDSKCTRTGYATAPMMQQPCPSVVDCGVYYDIKGTGGNIDFTDATVAQRCESQTNNIPVGPNVPDTPDTPDAPDAPSAPAPTPPTPAPTPSVPTPTPSAPAPRTSFWDQHKWWIIPTLLAVTILIILVVLYWAIAGDSAPTVPSTVPPIVPPTMSVPS